jgi:hypothetical protein
MMASTDQPFNGGKGSPGFPEAQKSLDGDESFRIVISRSGAQVKEVVPEGKAGCGRGITCRCHVSQSPAETERILLSGNCVLCCALPGEPVSVCLPVRSFKDRLQSARPPSQTGQGQRR